MSGVADLDPGCSTPFRPHRVALTGECQPEDVEPGADIADPAWRKSGAALLSPSHAPASLRMSLSTPAAVTSAPAPGPVITSGLVLYLAVVKTS
jgi:hypothetical protein